jgi:hypothetical protein
MGTAGLLKKPHSHRFRPTPHFSPSAKPKFTRRRFIEGGLARRSFALRHLSIGVKNSITDSVEVYSKESLFEFYSAFMHCLKATICVLGVFCG